MTRNVIFSVVGVAGLAAILLAVSANGGETNRRLSKTDQLLVNAQKICPVSGKNLLSMGGPIKAVVDGRTTFLCCKGCFGRPINKDHWRKVNANLVTAQGVCPVRRKPLPPNPASTVVKGRVIFVCCPPCTGSIKSDPDRYIGIVDSYLQSMRVQRK